MEVRDLVDLIANVGFPVAVSAYLLIRLEGQIKELNESINRLSTIVATKLGKIIE